MRMRIITAVLAAFSLAGCGYVDFGFGGDEANQSGNAAAGNAAATQNQAQAQNAGVSSSRSLQQLAGADGGKDPSGGAPAGPIDPAMLLGAWGDDGDCSSPTELFADGTFRAPNGAEGNWRLEGNVLIASGPNGTASLRLSSVTANELVGIDAQGQPGRSIRC